MTANFICTLCS